jgi:hypothetical protein
VHEFPRPNPCVIARGGGSWPSRHLEGDRIRRVQREATDGDRVDGLTDVPRLEEGQVDVGTEPPHCRITDAAFGVADPEGASTVCPAEMAGS